MIWELQRYVPTSTEAKLKQKFSFVIQLAVGLAMSYWAWLGSRGPRLRPDRKANQFKIRVEPGFEMSKPVSLTRS